MAITQTQTHAGGVLNVAVGRYLDTGTAAAFVITTGFKPRWVRVVNIDPDADGETLEWFEGMADAEALKIIAAGTRTLITTLGITVSESGFTVGLDLDVNVTDEQISWIAIG